MQIRASRPPSSELSGDIKGFARHDASAVLLNCSNLGRRSRAERRAADENSVAMPRAGGASMSRPSLKRLGNAMNFVEANGAKIPAIGLGTMTLMDAVCVDTVERYRNESEVGEGLHRGLRAAGIARDDVFVTTKVFQDQLAAADFERSLDQSLKKLRLAWVDLLLIHWPSPNVPLKETLGVLCKAKRDGRAKHIGVANFTIPLLQDAVKLASELLVTN